MTHHNRLGGRTGEVFLLFGLIAVSVMLVLGGLVLAPYLAYWLGGSQMSGIAGFAGAAIGFSITKWLWAKYLRFYKYSDDLKPVTSADET